MGMDFWKRRWPDLLVVALALGAAVLVAWAYARHAREENHAALYGDPEQVIYLVTVGPIAARDRTFGAEILAASFNRRVVFDRELPLIAKYSYPERRQYGGGNLLNYVEANIRPGAKHVVALTAGDIFTGDLNFIFGISRCPGRCSLFSTARLGWYTDNPKARDVRLAKILIHETGHAFGLRHCTQPLCIMAFADGFDSLDNQRLALCPRCEGALLAKTGGSGVERRERLRAVMAKYGLWEAAGGDAALAPPLAGALDPYMGVSRSRREATAAPQGKP